MRKLGQAIGCKEIVSPERFIRMVKTERDQIKRVRVIPMPLGSSVFGLIEVERDRPVYLIDAKVISNKR